MRMVNDVGMCDGWRLVGTNGKSADQKVDLFLAKGCDGDTYLIARTNGWDQILGWFENGDFVVWTDNDDAKECYEAWSNWIEPVIKNMEV